MIDDLDAGNGGQEVDIDRLTQDMHADQEVEIVRMRALLDELPAP